MTIISAAVLLVAALFTAFRVPAVTKGRGRPILLAGLLAIAAFLMVTPAVYGLLDRIVPGQNTIDPVTKIVLFTAVLILGDQTARGLDSPRLINLISGTPGRIVFAVASLTLIVLFVIAGVEPSSPMLAVAIDQPAVALYTATAMAYFTYLSVLLFVGVARSVGRTDFGPSPQQLRGARTDKQGRVLMLIGFGLVPVRFLLSPVTFFYPASYDLVQVLPLLTFFFVVVGLAFIRVAARVARRSNGVLSFVNMLERDTARQMDPWQD